MSDRFDVAVIGLGAIGSAVALELSRRGQRVVGFDAHAIPNTMGSHHGGTRVIRLAYGEHPDYVPLLRRAFAGWRQLEDALGESIIQLTGGLYMGPPDGPFVTGVRQTVAAHGLAHEMLDAGALHRRFPQLRPPEGTIGVLERQAGALFCERIVAGQARLAMTAGAVLHGHCPVIDWSEDGGGVTVRTANDTFAANQLVITGGAWSGRLLADLNLPLTVTRQLFGWFQPRRPARFGPNTLPIWGLEHADGGFEYGFPTMPDRPGVKYGHHMPGPSSDPDTLDRRPGPADAAQLRSMIERHAPDAAGPLLSMAACPYTNSPDGHFIVDHVPGSERVVFATGFSGHGFKFAPVMGEALADLAVDGGTRLPIEFLGLSRFDADG